MCKDSLRVYGTFKTGPNKDLRGQWHCEMSCCDNDQPRMELRASSQSHGLHCPDEIRSLIDDLRWWSDRRTKQFCCGGNCGALQSVPIIILIRRLHRGQTPCMWLGMARQALDCYRTRREWTIEREKSQSSLCDKFIGEEERHRRSNGE